MPAADTPTTWDPKRLTRSTFISPDLQKIAAALPTMYALSQETNSLEFVPTPMKVKETGIIPAGFSVGMIFYYSYRSTAENKRGITDLVADPAVLVMALADMGITDVEYAVLPSCFHRFDGCIVSFRPKLWTSSRQSSTRRTTSISSLMIFMRRYVTLQPAAGTKVLRHEFRNSW